jgi:hypothetical protein
MLPLCALATHMCVSIRCLTRCCLPTLQRQAAGQRGDQEGPGKGSVGIGQKLQDLAGQATKGSGGAGGNQVQKDLRSVRCVVVMDSDEAEHLP